MMETNRLEKSIQEIFDGQYKYIVPLYQRNFAWRRDEIEQLLHDIYEAYKTNRDGNYFIGSLIVLKRSNGDYEVIDGQQRLTTLSLITKILGINQEPRLFYDSRPEVEEFFREFYKTGNTTIDYPQTFHLRNAIDYIKETSLDASGKEDIKILDDNNNIVDFKDYFANNVILVRVEIPQDTDVASYFEIMNNRGEQLQKHEILKSLLLSKLSETDNNKTKEFARIWDACSQMDIPIQKLFDADTRKRYFGIYYNEFLFKTLSDENYTILEPATISTILNTQLTPIAPKDDKEDEQDIDESIYKSIIDFPNFLMHVFKVKYQSNSVAIPLNEKYLLSTYNGLKTHIDPEEFIKTLFFCRTVFDRYIIKTIADKTDNEDGEKWTLRKPKKHDNSWDYVDTFGKDDDDNFTSKEQDRAIKALSMLQVSFRTRIYKTWLYEILAWFVNEKNNVNIQYNQYIKKLDEIILKSYKPIGEYQHITEDSLTRDNSYSLGTKTPHFVFNFIDYLYWVQDQNNEEKQIKDFDFKYWNSIEHHLAKEWATRNSCNVPGYQNYIDNLGNLCLISKSSNSRLSDRDVKEKVDTFGKGNLGAKRQIMYKMTKDNGYVWVEEQIKTHYNELLDLINNRNAILEHKEND